MKYITNPGGESAKQKAEWPEPKSWDYKHVNEFDRHHYFEADHKKYREHTASLQSFFLCASLKQELINKYGEGKVREGGLEIDAVVKKQYVEPEGDIHCNRGADVDMLFPTLPVLSSSLISALENGLTLQKDYAVAFPENYSYTEKGDCIETLWMEVNNGNRYFYRHGWGSALGKTSDVIMEVLTNPERWTIVKK